MLNKTYQRVILLVVAVLISSFFTACSDKGKLYQNSAPTIEISSFGGNDNSVISDTVSFQQKIYWSATDHDGTVAYYAFRVLNKDLQPISTPGYEFLDTTGELTPDNLKNHENLLSGESNTGWVLHYQKNADESVPLDNPYAKRDIRTTKLYAVINFPACDTLNQPRITPSIFEVVAFDNRGKVSNIARRYFNVESAKPTVLISSSKGQLEEAEVGLGLRINFTISDTDPYIGSIPWYFRYKLKVVDNNGIIVRETEWFDTKRSYKKDQVDLTGVSNPRLSTNYSSISDPSGTTQVKVSTTYLLAQAVDLAGIYSDVDTVGFYVNDSFKPQSVVYPNRIYALGDYHYSDVTDMNNSEVVPETNTPSGKHFATQLFLDFPKDGPGNEDSNNSEGYGDPTYKLIGDQATKFFFRWGFSGEYESDDPNQRKQGVLKDANNRDYLSEVKYYWVQLDGRKYNFLPLMSAQPAQNELPEPWLVNYLRIPVDHIIAQKITTNNLTLGLHSLKVVIEDLQGAVDLTPAEFKFEIVSKMSAEEKSGILVVDSDEAQSNLSPEGPIDFLYQSALSGYSNVHYFDRIAVQKYIDDNDSNMKKLSIRGAVHYELLASTYLQKFKYVIYHCDSPGNPGVVNTNMFQRDYIGLKMYLKTGGNIILSTGANLVDINNKSRNESKYMLQNYFGIPADPTLLSSVQASIRDNTNDRPWLIGVNPVANTNLSGLTLNVNSTSGCFVVSIYSQQKGLGPVAYFKPQVIDPSVTPLYTFRSKLPYSDNLSPDQENYDEFSTYVMATKKVYNDPFYGVTNTCYLFTFPLSYMGVDGVRNLFNQILQ